MSKYTTEVRFICETYAGYNESQNYDNLNAVIENSRAKVFDFDFPIFDETYRSVLETKILKHFYTREIGFETAGLWKHFLDMRLNEVMPYYNKLYQSELLTFNPFYDVDVTTTGNNNGKHDETSTANNVRTDNLANSSTRTDNLTSSSTRTDNLEHAETVKNTHADSDNGSNSNTQYDLYSDTPQGALNGVESETYLTTARKITNNGTDNNTNNGSYQNDIEANDTGTQEVVGQNTGTQKIDGTNTGTVQNTGNGTLNYSNTSDYLEHVVGKRGGESYAKLLNEYRETFLNIDMMVINELNDLFMNVW